MAPGQAEPTNAPQKTLVSITPFPFDLTAAAASSVAKITSENETLATVQLDNGIPWAEALDGEPFSADVMGQWQRDKDAIGTNRMVYLAIAPLQEDRVHWALGPGGASSPSWAANEKTLTPKLKQAYGNYVLRAIDYFNPQFLNLGVEAGDMAWKKPGKWPSFTALFDSCCARVREKNPSIKIGISFSLPLLMNKGVAKRAKSVIDTSDYVGISFYPYLSDFYVKLGAQPLPAPPLQWREPLAWLATNISKPIAICETDYSSDPVSLPSYDLKMDANPDLQRAYVTDLAAIARRENYLFTVFFLSVDCDALMSKLPAEAAANGLWTHCGFLDKQLREKPAWQAYRETWLGRPAKASEGSSPTQN